MKKTLFLLTVACVVPAMAQVSVEQQRISRPAPVTSSNGTNSFAVGSLNSTNPVGQNYSVNELAAQLNSLNTAVEQTLPLLSAFNSEVASSSAGTSRGQKLANAITGVLSGALGRSSNQNSSVSGPNYGSGISNFAQALNGLLHTNSNGSATSPNVDAYTVSQLRSLETDLGPVLTILRNLHLSTNAPGGFPSASPSLSNQPGTPGSPVTPTGR